MATAEDCLNLLLDPLEFQRFFWPDITLYDQQVEILRSVQENNETVVVAGNDLGKDFIAALVALHFFCSRSPCRVVTTSVDGSQLEAVLWGEIRRFIQTAAHPLPIHVNHLQLRQQFGNVLEPRSEMRGRVVARGEGLLGRHLELGPGGRPRTLVIFDEASAMYDVAYKSADTWAHRKLLIGNPYPCENHFRRAVEGGDRPDPFFEGRLYRKVIRIRAEDSPNVRRAQYLAENYPQLDRERILEESDLVPGVLNWRTYQERRSEWDAVSQCIGLDAEFYSGEEVRLYPPEWLLLAARIELPKNRVAASMGVDVGEGGDSTVWTVVDSRGVLEQVSLKTPDTSEIPSRTINLMQRWNLADHQVYFDLGGGGHQIADFLRQQGYDCNTVAFGGSATSDSPTAGRAYGRAVRKKRIEREPAYTYKNKRSEMYGLLRYKLLDPTFNEQGFSIPAKYEELRRQLAVMPFQLDAEGRLYLPPKDKPRRSSKEVTLRQMLGCSPDEADSLVLATYGLFANPRKRLLKVG